jgi:imidazolonepropionase-like amidohydrolase
MPLVKLDQQTTGVNDIARANAVMVLDEMVQGIHAAREHGITIGMGTDSALTYVTHYDTWRELDLLVRVGGLTPAQTLNAATRTNARILGLDDITGSIEPGIRGAGGGRRPPLRALRPVRRLISSLARVDTGWAYTHW